MNKELKELKEKNRILGKEISRQLRECVWSSSSHDNDRFYNNHFTFEMYNDIWKIKFNNIGEYNFEPISLFIPKWKFFLLYHFFVKKSIRNTEKYQKIQEISKMSDKFFQKNKDLIRNQKLNNILD